MPEDHVTVELAAPTTTATTTDSRVTATVTDTGTRVSVVESPVAVTSASGLTVTVGDGGGGGSGTGTVNAAAIWALVQDTGAEFRADEITTALTHAERAAIAAENPANTATFPWPDGPVGFATVGDVVYGWGSAGSVPVRVTYDVATGAFSGAVACTVDVGSSGETTISGGPVIYSSGRYVMFGHGEPGLTGYVLTSTDGLAWSHVGAMGSDMDPIAGGHFVHPSDGFVYLYPSDDGDTICVRVDHSDLFAWAAGGSPATFYRWTGSAWSATVGSGALIAGSGFGLAPVQTCAYSADLDRVVAFTHDSDGTVGYAIRCYVIDPDEPYTLSHYHYAYRDTADEFVDPGSNIGYLSAVAPDGNLDGTYDYVDLLRVDALEAGPGVPWDDTAVTSVRMRPAVSTDRQPRHFILDAVGVVTAGPTGVTIVSYLPNGQQSDFTVSGGADVVVLDITDLGAGWQRYITTSSGPWVLAGDQIAEGDRLQVTRNISGVGVTSIDFTVSDPTSATGIQASNVNWSRLTFAARTKLVETDTDYLASWGDGLIEVDTSGGDVTVTLYDPALDAGAWLVIRKATTDANTVIIDGAGYDIDGNTTYTLTAAEDSITLAARETTWTRLSTAQKSTVVKYAGAWLDAFGAIVAYNPSAELGFFTTFTVGDLLCVVTYLDGTFTPVPGADGIYRVTATSPAVTIELVEPQPPEGSLAVYADATQGTYTEGAFLVRSGAGWDFGMIGYFQELMGRVTAIIDGDGSTSSLDETAGLYRLDPGGSTIYPYLPAAASVVRRGQEHIYYQTGTGAAVVRVRYDVTFASASWDGGASELVINLNEDHTLSSATGTITLAGFAFTGGTDPNGTHNLVSLVDNNTVRISLGGDPGTISDGTLTLSHMVDTIDGNRRVTLAQGEYVALVPEDGNRWRTVRSNRAVDAKYTPSVSADWTTQPTTVAEALDMLAAWANPVP